MPPTGPRLRLTSSQPFALPPKQYENLSDLDLAKYWDMFCKVNPAAKSMEPWAMLLTSYKDHVLRYYGRDSYRAIQFAYGTSKLSIPAELLDHRMRELIREEQTSDRLREELHLAKQRAAEHATSNRLSNSSHPGQSLQNVESMAHTEAQVRILSPQQRAKSREQVSYQKTTRRGWRK